MPGVSPMANGKFPQETVKRLEYAGDWLKVNDEAISTTRQGGRTIQSGMKVHF